MIGPVGKTTLGAFQNVLTPLRVSWRFMRRWPVIPVFILVVLSLCGILGPVLAPHDATIGGGFADRQVPPGGTGRSGTLYVLGSDHIGRDMLSRIIIGARVSLMVAAVSLSCGFVVGTTIGVVSGYIGGLADEIIIRILDIWASLPFLMVALIVVLIFGQSLMVLLALLALLSWAGFVRIVRAQALVLREMDYIALARVAGAGSLRILIRHMAPGVVNSAIVIATLNVGGLILAEATLSFLGAGIPPPTPAWGVLVAEGRDYLSTAWWQAVFPGICIFLTVMSLNFLGDWLRDRLDPRLRQLME